MGKISTCELCETATIWGQPLCLDHEEEFCEFVEGTATFPIMTTKQLTNYFIFKKRRNFQKT